MPEKGMLVFYKYKHLLIAIFIIIIVIIFDIILENYSKNSIEKVDSSIEKINELFDSKSEKEYDKEKMEKITINTIKNLKKKADILSCFIEHEEVEKINIKLKQLKAQIENEMWGDAKITLAETKQLTEYLREKYKFSIQNLF